MGSHYFDEHQHSPRNRKVLSFRFLGFNYKMESESGVFSKDGLDTGTSILLTHLSKEEIGLKVLDYGCGIGSIGIILKTIFPSVDIEGFDINSRAVELAQENAALNDVDVKFYQSNQIRENQVFDTIVMNPPIRSGKANIYQMFLDSFNHLRKGGSFWIVMRKSHGALSAIKELETRFSSVSIKERDKGFFIIQSVK